MPQDTISAYTKCIRSTAKQENVLLLFLVVKPSRNQVKLKDLLHHCIQHASGSHQATEHSKKNQKTLKEDGIKQCQGFGLRAQSLTSKSENCLMIPPAIRNNSSHLRQQLAIFCFLVKPSMVNAYNH